MFLKSQNQDLSYMSLLQIVWNVDVLEGQTTERIFLDENLKLVGLLLGLFCF